MPASQHAASRNALSWASAFAIASAVLGSAATAGPLQRAGKLRFLAVTAPQRLASADTARPAPVAEPVAQPALCQSCGRVTDVHAETRHGKASGVGVVGGAVVGGLLGNAVGGRHAAGETVAGAALGAAAGSAIGTSRVSASKRMAPRA